MPRLSPLQSRLLAWPAAFLGYRLFCLWLFVDGAWTPEESYRGTIALEFARALHGDGLRLPFWCHQADDYLGGSLVTAALTAIGYQLLGVRLLTLKLTAILFALLALCVAYRLVFREIGARAADRFALLYVVAPPAFVFLGATAMGYHTESVLFLAALLSLATRINREPARARAFFWLGAVGAFGFWFSNINALALAAALAALPRTAWERPGRALAAFAAGLAAGGAPWVAQNLSTGFSALRALGNGFAGAPPLPAVASKILALGLQALPLSSGLPLPLAYAHFGLLCGLAIAGLRASPPAWRRYVLVYSFLFVLFYGVSRYSINTATGDLIQFRYLQPLNLALLLCAAAAPARLRWLTGALVLSALTGMAGTERPAPPGRAWSYRPYSYPDLSAKVMSSCYRGPQGLAPLLAWIGGEPRPRQPLLRYPFLAAYDFAPVLEAPPPEPGDRFFAEGFGRQLAATGAPANRLLARAAAFAASARPFYWRGVSAGLEDFEVPLEIYPFLPADWLAFHRALRRNVRACFSGAALSPETAGWEARGQGAALVDCGLTETGAATKAELLARGQESAFRANLAWGLGWRLRMRHLPDPLRAADRINQLPTWAREGARSGARDFERDLGLDDSGSIAP